MFCAIWWPSACWAGRGGCCCCWVWCGSAGLAVGHAKVAMPGGGRPCGESPENADDGVVV